MTISSKTCMRFFLYVLIFLTVVLPSGSFLGFNYKVVLIGLCFLFFLFSLFGDGLPVYLYYVLLCFFLFLVFYFLVALMNGVAIVDSVSHAVAFLSLFCLVFFSLSLFQFTEGGKEEVKKVVVASVFVYSLLKFFVCFLIMVDYFSPELVQSFLFDYFGFEFIGLDAGLFYRIHIPIDFLLPLVFLYVYFLGAQELSLWRKILVETFVFFAVLISYSRLLYFVFFVVVLLVSFDYIKKRGSINKIIFIFVGFAVLAFASYAASDFFVERYAGEMAEASDGPRVEMFNALINVIGEFPLLGKGLGSGADSLIRFTEMPWYYELQWLSFLAQFGVLGFWILFGLALLPVSMVLLRRITYFSFSVLVVYLLWLGVGIFNGFMLTSSAGVIFLFFLLLFDFDDKSYGNAAGKLSV